MELLQKTVIQCSIPPFSILYIRNSSFKICSQWVIFKDPNRTIYATQDFQFVYNLFASPCRLRNKFKLHFFNACVYFAHFPTLSGAYQNALFILKMIESFPHIILYISPISSQDDVRSLHIFARTSAGKRSERDEVRFVNIIFRTGAARNLKLILYSEYL